MLEYTLEKFQVLWVTSEVLLILYEFIKLFFENLVSISKLFKVILAVKGVLRVWL